MGSARHNRPETAAKTVPFRHPSAEPVESVSGHYTVDEEAIMSLDGRDILYFLGYACLDTSCCGPYGDRFALVAGEVVGHRANAEDAPLSHVTPLTEPEDQDRLRAWLGDHHDVRDVRFWALKY